MLSIRTGPDALIRTSSTRPNYPDLILISAGIVIGVAGRDKFYIFV